MTGESAGRESTNDAPHDEGLPEEGSLWIRTYTWLSSNGLYIEAAIAIIALAAGAVALPFVTFGALTAIGGETSILTVGVVIVAVFIGLLLLLATVLLIHGYVEFRYSGAPFVNGTNKRSLVYRGTRLVETFVSGIFLLSLVVSPMFILLIERVPSLVSFAVVSTALVLPFVVLLHAFGVGIVSVFN